MEEHLPHVPDLSTFEGIHDLFTLCNVIELANAAHPDTYEPPGIPAPDRMLMLHARKQSREIVTWVVANYEFEGQHSIDWFYWRYLAYQSRALCRAKDFAESKGTFSSNQEPIAEKVRRHVKNSFKDVIEFWPHWDDFSKCEPRTFAWPSRLRYVVQRRTSPLNGSCLSLSSCAIQLIFLSLFQLA